jgi:microcystin degradation protein MlrC
MADLGSAQQPRIAIGGMLHESNTYSKLKTGLPEFETRGLFRGPEIIAEFEQANNEISGYIQGAKDYGFELYPTIVGWAVPSGPVTDEALDTITGDMIQRLKQAPKLDGLLLALHGAMVNESHWDADAEVVRRLRAALGDEFPIVVTHDFHANVGEEIVRLSTALVTYKENPHIDQRERGLHAARIIAQIARGEVQPTQAIVKPLLYLTKIHQYTKREPLLAIVDETRRLEKDPQFLAVSLSGSYHYADVPNMAPSLIVVTDSDQELANREAQRLADMLWERRDRFKLTLPDAAAAVRQAIKGDAFPVVLVETGDNIGGGGPGDSTFILSELLKQKAQGWVVAIADPRAVQQAVRAGVGAEFEAEVGGKTDNQHGAPVSIRGRVKLIYDGQYIETEARHGGSRYLDQGLTAVVHVEGSTRDLPNVLLLVSRRHTPFSIHQLTSTGVYPERQKILVVKAAVAFRAAYEPIAPRIIEVDTPGYTTVNPNNRVYKNIRRPMYGVK